MVIYFDQTCGNSFAMGVTNNNFIDAAYLHEMRVFTRFGLSLRRIKNFNVAIFSDKINVINIKLRMVVRTTH